jgi:pyruvate,water dikinase
MANNKLILWFDSISMQDIEQVGGKNASLGEMIQHLSKLNIKVPNGFATTADAFKEFLQANNLEHKINTELGKLDVDNLPNLVSTGKKIRQWILEQELPTRLAQEIVANYKQLADENGVLAEVAVRSSATAEDLPDASFAGQQETFLNILGEEQLLKAVKQVYASLYTDRAISYRVHQNFSHQNVALSVGVQKMVRSDCGASGVMFSLDTESGFEGVVFITSSYGLGEMVVQGAVNPDEFYVEKRALQNNNSAIIAKKLGSKQQKMIYTQPVNGKGNGVEIVKVEQQAASNFSLTDSEIVFLAKQALIIAAHYKRPMDIEWAKDGIDNSIYILQARPETVTAGKNKLQLEKYNIYSKGELLAEGRSVGQKIGFGLAKIIKNVGEINKIQPGDVLVTDMTDPDWEPIMKKAAAIVTNRGGRTCHAAIIARELGIPAVVGCSNATVAISEGQLVTVSCAEGDAGFVYAGKADFACTSSNLSNLGDLPVKIMMNIGNPTQAFAMQKIPNAGVGLARLEFIINQMIGIHPKACLDFANLPVELQQEISKRSKGYASPVDFYVDKLVEGIAMLGAAFWPKPVILRLSDFKSNEYANLVGGQLYEPYEENPMLGFRGASRYTSARFKDCFALECKAVKRVREEHGLTNIQVMIPFVRTLTEAQHVIASLEDFGLQRGENDLKIIMMCEIPSNAILAKEFLQYFDGFSIGSNDLTQLTLGVDRDSAIIAHLFSEQDSAVYALLEKVIAECKIQGKYVGICGQGPSDHPEFAKWLVLQGIDSISLTPDSILTTRELLTKAKNLCKNNY